MVKRTRRMPRYGGDGAEQFHEIPLTQRRVAIRIHGLAEQLDFGVAGIGEAARFGEHGVAGAAAFRSPRVRDDAVGASVIATFDDGDVGTEGIIAAGDFGLEGFVSINVEAQSRAARRIPAARSSRGSLR